MANYVYEPDHIAERAEGFVARSEVSMSSAGSRAPELSAAR